MPLILGLNFAIGFAKSTNIDLVGVQGTNFLRFHVTKMSKQHAHLPLALALKLDRNEKKEIKFLWLLLNCIHLSKVYGTPRR
jgi:hypothetical protein